MVNDAHSKEPGQASKPSTKGPSQKRPNYHVVHANPLPLKTYPLPVFIPQNPLSLVYLVYTYVSQLLFPPSSHPGLLCTGIIAPDGRSVHVKDEATARALWESGFFGKGSLSRSEPSWLDREKRRRGITVGETAEEITQRRRVERKEFKKDRARKEREAIERKLDEELAKPVSEPHNGAAHVVDIEGPRDNTSPSPRTPAPDGLKAELSHREVTETSTSDALARPVHDHEVVNLEHLQLTPEESFFLAYGLGTLSVTSISPEVLTNVQLLRHFRQTSYFPSRSTGELQPDDPFLTSYIVYHHFRSLGWVVRSGVKFAVDYLLYIRGPVFSHAEFAIVILPAYTHRYWHESAERAAEAKKKQSRSWWWLHCVNRVQSQVRKSLVLVYVEIPPPRLVDAFVDKGDITGLLKCYKVREILLKRWIPNRSRD